MDTYRYEAVHKPGQIVEGEIDAEDAKAAAGILLQRGYHVLRVEEAGADSAFRPRFGLFGGLKRLDLTHFTRDLGVLLRAGLALSQALSKMHARGRATGWDRIATGLRSRLEEGQTFSQALGAYETIFDPMYTNLVRSGEEGGTLPEVLMRLADLGERRDEIQSKVKMALVYPAVMLGLGCVTVLVLVTFVVPKFSEVFEEMGQSLPLPTQILVDTTHFMQHRWWALLPMLAIALLAALRASRSDAGRRLIARLSLRLPQLGKLVTQAEVAAFAVTLGTLLRNGIPIVNALAITANTLKNPSFREEVRHIESAVREGDTLAKALNAGTLFPPLVASVVQIGEESGTLDESLLQIAQEIERALERQLRVAMTLLEPALIVFVGAIVGLIVMAMLLPIFQLGDTIPM